MNGRSTTGLTIVELLLAMGLGLAIVLMAFSALRAMQQAYRIAIQERATNGLLIAGYRMAMAELDGWQALDDPTTPTTPEGTLLRQNKHPFAPLDLPDAAWRWAPSDPRTWDRSGMRSYRFAHNNTWIGHLRWPDHSQVAGVGHGDAIAAFLPETQQAIAQTVGPTGLGALLPGHIPRGYIHNTHGWLDHSPNTFARSDDGLQHMLIDGLISGGDTTATFHAGRWGRLQQGKRWQYAPRPGWSALPGVVSTAHEVAAYGLMRSNGTTMVSPGLNLNIDPLLLYAGSPAAHADDLQRRAYRIEVRRWHDASGSDRRVAVIMVADNDTGRELSVTFQAAGSTLRGARMLRGLDQ